MRYTDAMRILHADTDDLSNPLRGGQPVRTFEINDRLSARNDITVLTATYPGSVRRLHRNAIAYRRLGLTIPGLGLSPHMSFLASLGMAVLRMPHDLVVEEFTPPIGFSMLPWWTRKPVICVVQWFSFDFWQRRYKLPFERIMRVASRRAPYRNFIVQSEKMGSYFRELAPTARIWKLGCGVGNEMFQPHERDGDHVLFLGRLDVEHKGLDILLDAWERIRGQGMVIPLRLVGEGPGRDYLTRQIAARRLGDCITMLGRLEVEFKRDALRMCRFMVMPSRSETFGIVALEAMAASKAVIAFDIDNLNEVLRPGWAVLTGKPDADALAAAVVALWHDPDRSRGIGAQAFTAAQPHRWDTIARRQEAIYEEVCATAAPVAS